MQRRYTVRFQLLLLGAWTTLVLGAFSGPAVIAVGTPMIILVAFALLRPRTPFGSTSLSATDDSSVCFEGDVVRLHLHFEHLNSERHRLEIRNEQMVVGIYNLRSSDEVVEASLPLFGSYRLAGSTLIREGYFGLYEDYLPLELSEPIKVFPMIEDVTPLARLVKAQFALGRHRSTQQSHAGLEFIDVREAGPGDPLTDVNWKTTARTGNIWLNQRSSDLPLDLVILLDTFPSAALTTLVKLASNLARAHLRNFDRVGLVVFGGTIGWIPPASGHFQERLISERLLLIRAYTTAADKRIDLIPQRALPRTATVMVVSALYDRRIIQAIKDLRFAGHQVVVVGPVAFDGFDATHLSHSDNDDSDNDDSGHNESVYRVPSVSSRVKRLNTLIRRQLLDDLAGLNVTVIDTDLKSTLSQRSLSHVD